MIRQILKASIRRFAARYAYDADYMNDIVDTSVSAGLRLAALPLFTQFAGPKAARDIRAGAVLASTLDGDCGPCVQLVFDMAVEAKVPANLLVSCLRGRPDMAGEVGLGFRFAQAAIADSPDLEEIRAEIERRHGKPAVVVAVFAASSGRIYPVLKRGLGFGQTCSKVEHAGEAIRIMKPR